MDHDTPNQPELPLDDPRQPNPEVIKFHDYVAKHPAILAGIIAEARIALATFGVWHAHHAVDTLRLRTGSSASRSFAPAFARMIQAECPDLRGKCQTRPSKFGR
jgi:hypothetical protein